MPLTLLRKVQLTFLVLNIFECQNLIAQTEKSMPKQKCLGQTAPLAIYLVSSASY